MTRAHRIAEAGLLYGALVLLFFGFPDSQPIGLGDLLFGLVIWWLLATQPQGEENQ